MEEGSLMKALAQKLFLAMNSLDLSELEKCLAEDAVFDFPGAGTIEGRRKIFLFFKVLFRMYPRLTFTVEDVIVEGEYKMRSPIYVSLLCFWSLR